MSIFSFILKKLGTYQPSNARIHQDILAMREEVKEWDAQLIPWTKEENDLLSLSQTNKTVKTKIGKIQKGLFNSIYHEPMLVYGFKEYLPEGKSALLFAKAKNREYFYLIKKKAVTIYINNDLIGTLKPNGQLISADGKRIFAEIDQTPSELIPVRIGEEQVGYIKNPDTVDTINPRAVQLLKNMNEDEEMIFFSLAIYEIIYRIIY